MITSSGFLDVTMNFICPSCYFSFTKVSVLISCSDNLLHLYIAYSLQDTCMRIAAYGSCIVFGNKPEDLRLGSVSINLNYNPECA